MNRNLGSLEPKVSSSEEKGVIIMNLKYILFSRIKILSKAETILFEGLIIFLEGHIDISSVCIEQIKTYYKDEIQNLILYIRELEEDQKEKDFWTGFDIKKKDYSIKNYENIMFQRIEIPLIPLIPIVRFSIPKKDYENTLIPIVRFSIKKKDYEK